MEKQQLEGAFQGVEAPVSWPFKQFGKDKNEYDSP